MSVLNFEAFQIDGSCEDNLKLGAKKIFEIIRPKWNNISFKIYSDGITNKIIGAWNNEVKDEQILFRIYGKNTDQFIDRKSEANNMKLLYDNGLGPELHATFANGISYSFIKGKPLDATMIREEKIWKKTAECMAKFHKVKTDAKESCLFTKMHQFHDILTEELPLELQARLKECGFGKSYIYREIKFLESKLNWQKCDVVFCHNDILLANIIWNESKGTIDFIDYEYSAPNYQPFDIANHFNEYAGVENIDYNLFPDKQLQEKWIRHYLLHYLDTDHVEEQRVKDFIVLVNEFTLASHIFWGAWALFQACHSSIDFDFIGFAVTRLREYEKRKPQIFPS